MTKISQLSSIGDSLAVGDQFLIRDIDDAGSPNKSVTVSGITRALDLGTAAAPAIAFATDKNSGIFSPGADQVAISTAGTGRLFVDASGSVGVGTQTPSNYNSGARNLVIEGGSNTGLTIGTNSLTGNSRIYFADSAGGSGDRAGQINYEHTNNSMWFATDGGERMRLTSAGLLGLGISTPAARLDAVAAETGTYAASTQQIVARLYNQPAALGSGVNSAFLSLQTTANGSVQNPIARIGVVGESYASNNGSFVIATRDGAGVSERLRVTSTGAVGIGTTSPATTLDVNGDVTITDKIIHGGDTNTAIRFPAADTVSVETAGSERARIDSSGRLLVGTSTAEAVQHYRQSGGNLGAFQVVTVGTGANTPSFINYGANANGPQLSIGKSRGAALGDYAIVNDGDNLGSIFFFGADGTDIATAGAGITAQVDGTPGANDMPGRLVFSTTSDGAATPTERLRITSAGVLQVADAGNITVGTTTGTKIGTATTQKIGFYNATPVVQPAAVADATTAIDVITQLNDLLAKLRTLGIIAT